MKKKINIKKEFKDIIKRSNDRFNILSWLILIMLSIRAFRFKDIDFSSMGCMLLLQSFVFFPWLNRITEKFNFKFTFLNKLFIFIGIFFCFISVIMRNKTIFMNIILPMLLSLLVWFIVILYIKKLKNNRSKK